MWWRRIFYTSCFNITGKISYYLSVSLSHRYRISQKKQSVQGRTVILCPSYERTWFKMLIRLSLVENSYVMEKIFAFSESGGPFISNMQSIFIYLYDSLTDFLNPSKLWLKTIDRWYPNVKKHWKQTGCIVWSHKNCGFKKKNQTKNTTKTKTTPFHTFTT